MIISRSQALAQGTTDDELNGLVRAGKYVKVRRGIYAAASDVTEQREGRHRVELAAMALRSDYALSHVSAAVMHGLPVPGADLSEIHAVRVGVGGNRHQSGRHVHSGRVAPQWLTRVDEIPVTTVARSVVDTARTQPLATALAAADAALHRHLCTVGDLRSATASVTRHRGVRRARTVVGLADGRAESPGESRARLALMGDDLPPTELQICIYDDFGEFVARVDGGYPDLGVLWEYDGRGKYAGEYNPDISATDAVLAEKHRENRLVELGWIVIRIDAADLRDPARMRERIRAALRRAQRPGWGSPSGSYILLPHED
jgi:hypothetical protein